MSWQTKVLGQLERGWRKENEDRGVLLLVMGFSLWLQEVSLWKNRCTIGEVVLHGPEWFCKNIQTMPGCSGTQPKHQGSWEASAQAFSPTADWDLSQDHFPSHLPLCQISPTHLQLQLSSLATPPPLCSVSDPLESLDANIECMGQCHHCPSLTYEERSQLPLVSFQQFAPHTSPWNAL